MRLTCKMEKNGQIGYDIKEKYVDKPNSLSIWASSLEAMTKLGQLEDVEEELGIDLVTLINAFKNGFCYKEDNKIVDIKSCDLFLHTGVIQLIGHRLIFASGLYEFYFKDYGKTWALTKEELEK